MKLCFWPKRNFQQIHTQLTWPNFSVYFNEILKLGVSKWWWLTDSTIFLISICCIVFSYRCWGRGGNVLGPQVLAENEMNSSMTWPVERKGWCQQNSNISNPTTHLFMSINKNLGICYATSTCFLNWGPSFFYSEIRDINYSPICALVGNWKRCTELKG